jgi:hypothetical protein
MPGKETASVLKLLVLILPIAAIILISGCTTGGGGGVAGPGIVILNWEPDYSSVESRDDVQLRLKIKNQGGEQADSPRALLTGMTFGGDEWLLIYGTEEESLKPYLLPRNPRYGTEGEEVTFIWELSAPLLPEGITQTYQPGVRIFYDYVTTGVKPITLVNENELRHLVDIGGTLPTQASQHSGGPLAVTVVTGKHIKVVEERRKTFPITIHIQNTGGGIPYWVGQGSMLYGIPEESEYRVLLAVSLPPGLGFVTCSEYAGTGSGQGSYIQLWKGRDADITCELEILTMPPVSQEGTIKFYLTYGYAIDRSTSVTVKGLYGG